MSGAEPTAFPRTRRPTNWWFALLVPAGLFLLWILAPIGLAVAGFEECLTQTPECERFWAVQAVRSRLLTQMLVVGLPGMTLLGILAVVRGRVLLPAVLLAICCALLVLPSLAGRSLESPLWWLSPGLSVTTPALLVLALAAAGQILDQLSWTSPRPPGT